MNELKFDNGLVSYEVNGVPNAVAFNPTDMSFVDKLLNFFEDFSKRHERMSIQIRNMDDKRKIFDLCDSMDKEIRAGIDSIFGENVCAVLFGEVGTCAVADGLPIWMNFVIAVMDEIKSACESQQVALNPRLQNLIEKYRKN